ncbi:MAG: YncE family protein [Mediterranea sp.]|jgi:hypothetical protein|nr:YncE family protein [Mediterranea sp.]
MKQILTHTAHAACLAFALSLAACDDLGDQPVLIVDPPTHNYVDEGTSEVYVLSEGLFNLNNSTLARYSFATGERTDNYFQANNRRGLGDTANDMALYGGKLYIVVNVSSTVEIVDYATGKSLRQIPMTDDEGRARQPRYIAFDRDKAYVCSFDGTVARIDTASMTVDGLARVGRNPDGICVQGGKLYVSNSGALDNGTATGVDNTVSVVDIATFRETKQIVVGDNPGKILPGIANDVYVVTRGSRIEDGDYDLVKIDCATDAVARRYGERVLNFAIDGPVAYAYTYNYTTQEGAIKVIDLNAGTVLRDNFITDGTRVNTPYGIQINPFSNNLYVTEARNYTVLGDVLCFDLQGRLLFEFTGIGLNPNTLAFSDRTSQGSGGEPQDPDAPTAFANRALEYVPAPGQFVNTSTSAYEEGFGKDEVLARATERLRKRLVLSLGACGGFVTVGFAQPIRNVEGEYDFKVWGNASYNPNTSTGRPGGSAEPGIVLVAADANGNGLPDDPWYELAGSEYGKPTETRGYAITYHRPQPADGDVRWTDNQGGEGYVYRNSYHQQASYYPLWVDADQLTFRGIVRLADNAVNENGSWIGYCYDWGYADNHPNNTDGSKFKIDWAVDADGQPARLERVDFVRVYSAVNQQMGWTGESSTEISTVEDLHFEE